jgi:Glucosamine 6-phosphate synthetase, contains amidotransferase and phosphosugar isomerase domains
MINLEKEIRQQPDVLANVRAANEAVIDKILADVKSAGLESIYFAARGTSDHACIYAQYLFGILAGIPCTSGTPSVVTKYGAKLNLKKQLVIGVSQSGKAEDVLAILKNGNDDGTITVAITNNPDSPMAKEAKYHLYCNAGAETSIAATKTFTSQMFILALLCGKWAQNDKFLAELASVPEKAAEALTDIPNQVGEIVKRYRYLTAAVVLGRGTSYAIALEGALKMLETNKLKMRGYAISDFHHGPVAQMYDNDLAIVIAPKGPTADDAAAMIEKLQANNAEILIISDDAATCAKSNLSIQIPSTGSDLTSPFISVIVLQLIALKLTEVKGVDPDQSNVLNKVTITK